MLKGIDPLLGPELLHALAMAGHGDVIALVDRNYPAYSSDVPVIRLDGVDTTTAAQAILTVLPVDTFVPDPLRAMQADGAKTPSSHAELVAVAEAAEGRPIGLELVPRFEFYEICRSAVAVVVTSDDRPYSCFLLTKGVV